MTASISDAAIRARAGNRCQCTGECGKRHYRSRCRCQPAFGGKGSLTITFKIVGQKQVCSICAETIPQAVGA